jgi:hypothetical protein
VSGVCRALFRVLIRVVLGARTSAAGAVSALCGRRCCMRPLQALTRLRLRLACDHHDPHTPTTSSRPGTDRLAGSPADTPGVIAHDAT